MCGQFSAVNRRYRWSKIITHNSNCWGWGISLCNACVSLVSVCVAFMISLNGNYTAIMLGELIPRVCQWWFPNGGSSFVRRSNSATPFLPQFKLTFRGGTNRVFGKPCFCPLPKRDRLDENGENDEFAFNPLKTRASLLRPPKTMKMTKMAGITQEKAWFRKNLVCSSLNFYLNSTSYFNLFFYLFFNPCFVRNLQPRFGNHGLQTLGDSQLHAHQLHNNDRWGINCVTPGRANHEVQTVNWNTGIFEAESA